MRNPVIEYLEGSGSQANWAVQHDGGIDRVESSRALFVMFIMPFLDIACRASNKSYNSFLSADVASVVFEVENHAEARVMTTPSASNWWLEIIGCDCISSRSPSLYFW